MKIVHPLLVNRLTNGGEKAEFTGFRQVIDSLVAILRSWDLCRNMLGD